MEFKEKIDQYLAGVLTESEKLAFENEMNTNAELKDAFSKQFLAKEAIKLAGIRKQVKEVHIQYHVDNESVIDSKPKLRKSWVSYISKIAASVAIFILGIGAYQFMNLSAQKVIVENTITYIEPTMRGEGAAESEISKAYKSADYDKVIGLNNETRSTNVEDQFLVSMAYFNAGNYKIALEKLDELLNDKVNNGQYINQLQYYKGLSLLGIGNISEATTVFKTTKADSTNPYSKNISETFLFKLKLLALKN